MTADPEAALLPAGPAHVAVLAALSREALDDPWSEALLARLLAAPGTAAWIALDRGRPAAFLLVRQAADEAEVLALATLPEARRHGLARRLLDHGLDRLAAAGAGRVVLEVAADNAPAQRLYAASGFTVSGRRKGYYARPGGAVDALLLARTL